MNSIKKTARMTGVLYLAIFFANLFVFIFVSSSLNVAGDTTATAENIRASESLYRSGVVSYLIVFLSEIGTTILLYKLLTPVNKTLTLLMVATRLMQAAVHAANLINFIFPLILINGGDYLTSFTPGQIDSLVLLFTDVHYFGVLVSEAFFAVSLFLLGYLVVKSELFPGFLGIMLAIAGMGYVLDSFGIFLMPQYATAFANIMFAPAIIAELSFTLWLLIKGIRTPKAESRQVIATA